MIEKKIFVKDYLVKSNLPASDYVINPYIGCPHACKYCYACFMKRFTKHDEPWGSFIDIKYCDKPISVKRLSGKSVFLSSVTDCYNKNEEKYCITRDILKQLALIDCEIGISTKSKLILRDIDLLKKCKNLKVAISVNTLDEKFRDDMDNASTITERIETLKVLHDNKIHTVLFMSPIFPGLTDFKAIINKTCEYVDEYWFENLNLRENYKKTILSYIEKEHSDLFYLYKSIYLHNDKEYWIELSKEIEEYCNKLKIDYINYFYHEMLVSEKK